MLGEIKKSLVEIVENNKIVLIDSCIDNPFIGEGAVSMFYDCGDLFALNEEQKECFYPEKEYTNFVIDVIDSHSNIVTIPEVKEEMHDKSLIIGEGYRFHMKKRKMKLKKGKKRFGSNVRDIQEYLNVNYNLCKRLAEIEKRPDYNTLFLYTTLLGNIKLLDESIGLVKEKPDYYMHRKRKKALKRDTDEKLAAMAFYLSIINETDVAFITGDTDLKRLIGTSYSLFHTKDIGIPEDGIFKKMKKYAPKIYSKLETGKYEGYKLFFDAKEEAREYEQFRIFKNPVESDTIKKSFIEDIMNAEKESAEIYANP